MEISKVENDVPSRESTSQCEIEAPLDLNLLSACEDSGSLVRGIPATELDIHRLSRDPVERPVHLNSLKNVAE